MNNPVIDNHGSTCWFNNKLQLHNDNGYAIIHKDGSKKWYLNGKEYTKKEWLDKLKNKFVYLWKKHYAN